MVLAVFFGVLAVLTGLIAVIGLVGSIGSLSGAILPGVIGVLCAVAFGLLARLLWRARQGDPIDHSAAARARRRSNLKRSLAVLTILAVLGMLALSVTTGLKWRQSVATQRGARVIATVTSIRYHQYCGRGGCTESADMALAYHQPVDGLRAGTLQVPNYGLQLRVGSVVQVRIDRSVPGHAELPGEPFQGVGGFVAVLVVTVVLAALGSLGWYLARRRRRTRAASPPPGGAGDPSVV